MRIRADNPGPLTLSGTNTWVAGREPAWIVDPGPALPAHVEAVAAEIERRGGCGGIAVTHDHFDHAEALAALGARLGGDVPVGAARAPSDVTLGDGDSFGPLHALAVPGHASDHLVFLWRERLCFSGDVVLGEGSVFVSEDMAGYLDALRRLRALPLELICPGHGPEIRDPAAKLEGYIAHRLERERRLLEALARGLRSDDELLDAAWDDVPRELRPVAALTLGAHMQKLRDEGRLPG